MSVTVLVRRIESRLAAGIIAGVLVLGMSACSGQSAQPSVSSGTAATAAQTAGSHVSAVDFAAALKRPGTTVLDVRTPAEFASGHLPGAVNLDISGDFGSGIAQLNKAAPYAMYYHSGNRSGIALGIMAAAGFTGAYDLAGGIADWQKSGGEVVAD